MQKGKIIYLNGITCTGKTTLSNTLQERVNEPFYWIAWDTFISMASKKFLFREGNDEVRVKAKFDLFSLLLYTIKSYSDIGINSIVDTLHLQEDKTQENKALAEAVKQLHEYPLLFVNVTCPTDELHRRKTKRGDPDVDKWLNYQLEHFVPKAPYDITVDTHNNTMEQCAEKIIELLDYPEKFTAFKAIWSQRTE